MERKVRIQGERRVGGRTEERKGVGEMVECWEETRRREKTGREGGKREEGREGIHGRERERENVRWEGNEGGRKELMEGRRENRERRKRREEGLERIAKWEWGEREWRDGRRKRNHTSSVKFFSIALYCGDDLFSSSLV